MRKFLKNSILEIFQTMYEAHVSIKKMIDKKDFENVSVLLEDCQNTAVQIGTSIEASEGEGFVTVGYLEEYCEAVYEVATSISDEYSGNKAQKTLDKKLIKAENSVKNDVKVRLEIVFCPYKASMWDSLESVWKAADEDPDCDAYVVPIPYYDRNPDYSFGEFHYEGGDYPDYVPITHYEAYNFEARRPDVVYIHNPYDEYNNVTSVDPRFYSHELKKYTECLVYIPYYLAYGSIGEGQRMTSVYNSADYIIIQNESYRKFFNKNIPDSKFLPLGSPKFDKIINTCKNKPALKPEWKIAEGKRVFFYNTTIAELLCNPEAFLKKMVYVFNTFIQYGENACLLWRPHPLLESTIKSMCPQFLDAYKELKNSFISHNIGIYDDNPDLNYSIALSDVYLGDASSSVASSFSACGKPIFLLNELFDRSPDNKDKKKSFLYFLWERSDPQYLQIHDKLFYSPNDDFKYEFCLSLSDKFIYTKIIRVGNKAYLGPISGNELIIFNNGTIENRIKINEDSDNNSQFYDIVANDRYIFIIPSKYRILIMYDTQTQNIRSITDGIEVFSHHNNPIPVKCSCILNNTIYVACCDENKVWSYNAISQKVSIFNFDIKSSKGFVCAANDGESIWLLSNHGISVTKWTPSSGDYVTYSEMPCQIDCYNYLYGSSKPEYAFSDIFFSDKYAYLIPACSNKFLKIEKETDIISEWASKFYCDDESESCYSKILPKCRLLYKNDEIFIVSMQKGIIYKFNAEDETLSENNISINMSQVEESLSGFRVRYGKYGCFESEYSSLSDFIQGKMDKSFSPEKQNEVFSEISNNLDGSCGMKIYSAVKRSLR